MNPYLPPNLLAEFEKKWDEALKCDEYATVQISPRKVLVLRDSTGAGRGVIADMRMPRKFEVVVTCPNHYTAMNYIRGLLGKVKTS